MRRRRQVAEQRVLQHGGARVEVVLIEGAAPLLTVRPEDPMRDVRGAIVRLIPAGESAPEERAALRDAMLRAGAAHVWIAPAMAAPRAVSPASAACEDAPEEPARAVVMRMVDEALSRDRDRLRSVVDEALSAEGA